MAARSTRRPVRYWVGVVARDHALRGVEGGFAQLAHGKATPLKQMRTGDWLVYYSSRLRFADREPCQAFTAIGQISGDEVYSVAVSDSFVPFRQAVRYLPCREAPIQPLVARLSFIADKRHWGYPFRLGHFEISADDFRVIAAAMGVEHSVFEPRGSAADHVEP